MKSLTFTVTVEDLPDHAKDYRVQGEICTAVTEALREPSQNYGKVNVIVTPPARPTFKLDEDDGTRRMRAYVAGEQKKRNKREAA